MWPCAWPVTTRGPSTCAGRRSTSARPGASAPPGSSPGSGLPFSACGPGTSCRCFRRSLSSCPSGYRSTSTTSAVGPARRWWPSPSSARTGRSVPFRSSSASWTCPERGPVAVHRSGHGPGGSPSSTPCSGATSAGRSAGCVDWPWAVPSAGSSNARRPTAPGGASSRRGSTPSWPSPAGLRPRPPGRCGRAGRARRVSSSPMRKGGGSRRASPRSGTPRLR